MPLEVLQEVLLAQEHGDHERLGPSHLYLEGALDARFPSVGPVIQTLQRVVVHHTALVVEDPKGSDRQQMSMADLFDPLDPAELLQPQPAAEVDELQRDRCAARRGGAPHYRIRTFTEERLQPVTGNGFVSDSPHALCLSPL